MAHHFQQAAQFTVRDLAGLPTEDTPAPTAILNRLNSRLNNVGSGGRTVYRDEAISLMGIYGWVKAIKISRTAGDTEEFSNVFNVAAELLQDVYLTPALAWVRTAYAMRIVEKKNSPTNEAHREMRWITPTVGNPQREPGPRRVYRLPRHRDQAGNF